MLRIADQLEGTIGRTRIVLSLLCLLLAPSIFGLEDRSCAASPKEGQVLVRPVWSPYRPSPPGNEQTEKRTEQQNGSTRTGTTDESSESTPGVEPIHKRSAEPRSRRIAAALPVSSATNPVPIPTPNDTHSDCGLNDDLTACSDGSLGCRPVPRSFCYDSDAYLFAPGSTGNPYCAFPFQYRRLWVRGEYLLWWLQGASTPPLVTTSPAAAAGRLDDPTTSVLFGGGRVDSGVRSGGRVTLGCWLDIDQQFGVEADYLGIAKGTARYGASSDGDPLLARPFFNIVTGVEDSHVFAFAPFLQGATAIDAGSEFHSAGIWLRRAFFVQQDARVDGFDSREYRVDFLLGYRFSRLNEDLRISETLEAAGPTVIDSFDLFDTENTFHGAELGVSAEFRYCRWSLELLMKLALGNTHSQVFIDGSTATAVGGGAPTTDPGGLLALSTNIGTYSQDHFAVMPEFGVTLGYDITPRLRATFGYTFLYWSRLARPGDQIDRDLNSSFIPNNGPPVGAPRPAFAFVTNDFWAQGMNFGLEYCF